MPPRSRGLSEADQALWADYASKIAPLRRRVARKPASPVATAQAQPEPAASPANAALHPFGRPGGPVRPKAAAQATKPRMAASPLSVGTQPGGIDKATWHRFQSGKLVTARTLDLHGMTAQRAFHALQQFLRSAHADQVRCVEVVTGRGSSETGGVIGGSFRTGSICRKSGR